VCKTAKKNRIGRINLTLTPEQTEKMDRYILNWTKKHGHIPTLKIKAKIARAAMDEWLEHHEDDLDIDWEQRE